MIRYRLAEMSHEMTTNAVGVSDGQESGGSVTLDAGLVWNRNHKVIVPPELQRRFVG